MLTINDADSLNNDAGVTSVAISPNGQFVAAGSLDTVVRIWDVSSGVLVERLRGHRDSVYSVAFTPDGKGLVSGSLDKTLKYWDVGGLVSMGGVKGRKEGANGGMSGPGRKEADKTSQCTMNFTGHKVGPRWFCGGNGVGLLIWVSCCRTTCSPWRCHMMGSGWCRAPRTAGCSSGTRGPQSCSVCCRGTRIPVRLSFGPARRDVCFSLITCFIPCSHLDRPEPFRQYACNWERGLASPDMCVVYDPCLFPGADMWASVHREL